MAGSMSMMTKQALRRQRWRAAALLALASGLLLAPPLRANERPQELPQIIWLMPEFSLSQPAGQPRKGMAEPMAEFLRRHWPEPARHQVQVANVKRSWKMIGDGEPACHLVSLRTAEREQLAYFANTHLVPPAQLIVRRSRQAELPLNALGEVELPRLLAAGRLRGALIDGRSYGPLLDGLLGSQPAGPTLARYAPSDFGGRLLHMLVLGRADYTIDFDFTLAMQRSEAPQLEALVSVPIAGGSAPLLSGVACPRNEWGRRTAERVAQLFASPEGVATLKRNFERWMTPEARQHYGERIEAFYAERLRARH